MAQTEDVWPIRGAAVPRKASLLSLAVLGHGRLLEDGLPAPDGNRLDQLQSPRHELEFGLGISTTGSPSVTSSPERQPLGGVARRTPLALALTLLPSAALAR